MKIPHELLDDPAEKRKLGVCIPTRYLRVRAFPFDVLGALELPARHCRPHHLALPSCVRAVVLAPRHPALSFHPTSCAQRLGPGIRANLTCSGASDLPPCRRLPEQSSTVKA